jgi:hypothetical protein
MSAIQQQWYENTAKLGILILYVFEYLQLVKVLIKLLDYWNIIKLKFLHNLTKLILLIKANIHFMHWCSILI